MLKTNALRERVEKAGHKYVAGEGNPASKVWIVGEAPGEMEEMVQKPFVGPSGNLLNQICRESGLKREMSFVTNVSPVRPPGNNLKKLEEVGVTKEECVEALKEQLEIFKPNCVFALGNLALEATTGKTGILEWRGTILNGGSYKVVPSFHPAYVVRMGDKTAKKEREGKGGVKYSYGSSLWTLVQYAKRAKEEGEAKEYRLPERDLLYEGSEQEELAILKGMEFWSQELAFDVETRGTFVDCISFANESGAISVKLGNRWRVKEVVAKLLQSHGRLVAQNASFDMGMLKKNGLPVGKLYADLMIAHHLLWPELPHSLGYMASIYCRMGDVLHPEGWAEPDKRGYYNALHSAVTREIWGKLKEELKDAKYI